MVHGREKEERAPYNRSDSGGVPPSQEAVICGLPVSSTE